MIDLITIMFLELLLIQWTHTNSNKLISSTALIFNFINKGHLDHALSAKVYTENNTV